MLMLEDFWSHFYYAGMTKIIKIIITGITLISLSPTVAFADDAPE
jgi:hypothetical protein